MKKRSRKSSSVAELLEIISKKDKLVRDIAVKQLVLSETE